MARRRILRPPEPAPRSGSGAEPRSPGRRERLSVVMERDGATCIWCARAFTGLVPPTTEHVVPRVKGGPSWLENEVAACHRCNADRGHRGPIAWLEECRLRGWEPDEARLARALAGLAEAIAREGGQRRARPYLDAQLRRLGRRSPVGSSGVPACPRRSIRL